MFDVGLPEFFVLGVIALLVFGPERLPEVAVQAARLIRRLRSMAESARTELSADLEPHMRELKELRELDPRKMAKRYVLDPVNEDGTFDELRGKRPRGDKARKPTGTGASSGSAPSTSEPPPATPSAERAAPQTNGSANGGTATGVPGPALPPAMAPAVTPAGERPPYDADAT